MVVYGYFIFLFIVSLICLVIGLIDPHFFDKVFRREVNRKFVGLVFGIAFVGFFIIAMATTPPQSVQTTVPATITAATQNQTPQKNNIVSVTSATPKSVSTSSPTPKPTPAPKVVTVVPPCIPNWQCTAWNACSNSTQTRTCNDSNNCNAANGEPTLSQSCTMPTPVSTETVSQQNAVRAAQSYLNYTAFSHDGLVAQLEYDQFSNADAVYGADNSGADWNAEAAKSAKQYMSYSAFSRGGLITQLEYDKFTEAQAEYGATAVGL